MPTKSTPTGPSDIVISRPYTQLGKVDSTFYSSASMLRTMELILGLAPLTQFDASANPIGASFSHTPNLKPYDAIKPQQSLTTVNSTRAPLAAASARMDFSREDQAPEQLLNQAIWKIVKGADGQMPAPRERGD